ncbi:hypothetical protein ACVDG3_12330 [Meridianimarinicoccus sp. RP-17]|uniref:hypothetical protein n=1 Tax=Meridianimarinicoccus zhengii TaxID=2056810 RepID=UPI000DAE200B|nr:hypothetical protein [Phycocomes zhengii]
MLIVTHDTLANPGILDTRSLPKKFLGRVMPVPRGAGAGLWLRLAVEIQPLRYTAELLPFIVAPLMVRDLATQVMQAPALMVITVAVVELKLLRLSAAARSRAVGADEAARRLDTLAFRARACLRRIAARHDMAEGELRLVVEQSELARIAPLTLVSVQADHPKPRVLPLDADDRAVLAEGLFDADFTERDLLAVNHSDSTYLRDITQQARAVSAHARLAARLDQRAAAAS